MPTKASITTRAGAGVPLTTSQMDTNLTNLRDQSIGFADDASTVLSVDSGSTITIAGAGTVSTALSGSTLTVTGTGISASSTDTLTNKTIDANGTGNAISNLEVADFAGSAIVTVAETLAANDSDTALVTAGAVIDYVDAQDANIASDTLTFTKKTLDANGTGNAISNIEVADMAATAVVTVAETLAANDVDTALVTAGAIIDYVDAQDANIASDTLTFTNKTFDVEGTGNSIANIDVADLKSGVLDTDLTTVSASDDTLASAKAIKTALDGKISDVVSDTTPQLGGNLDVNGNQIVSVSNGDIVLAPDGTGDIDLNGNVRFNTTYTEDVTTLTSSPTIAVDCSASTVSRVALGTNTQFTFNNLAAGQTHTLVIVSSGTYTATFDDATSTAVKFPGGAPTITDTGTDVVTVFNTGTEILGNIAQAFA